MVASNLHPDYYDYFPSFVDSELVERLEALPFHLATLLGLKNLVKCSSHPIGRAGLRSYFSAPLRTRRSFLAEVLQHVGISRNVAQAIGRVQRESFALSGHTEFCYINHYVPYSRYSCLSAPGLIALMIDQLALTPDQQILEIGIGSGYHAACVSEGLGNLCRITGWELNASYLAFGQAVVSRLGYENIAMKQGDGLDVAMPRDKYDTVYLTAAYFDGLPLTLRDCVREGGQIQYVRAVARAEFDGELDKTWLRRTFASYDEYANSNWRKYCCVATSQQVTGGDLRESHRLYDVTFIPLHQDPSENWDSFEDPFSELERIMHTIQWAGGNS